MDLEQVATTLETAREICLEQSNCNDCPLCSICGKLPCEW